MRKVRYLPDRGKSGFDRLSSSISSQRSKLRDNFRPNTATEGMSDTHDAPLTSSLPNLPRFSA